MGYCIQYSPENNKTYPVKLSQSKRYRKWFALIAALGVIVGFMKLDDTGTIKELLLPGDPEHTGQAIESLVQNVQRGGSVTDAFTTFCLEILDSAQQTA